MNNISSMQQVLGEVSLSNSCHESTCETSTPIGRLMTDFVQDVNGQQKAVEEQVQSIALGEADNLQDVAISVAKADLSFRFLMEVRDKLIASYQEVMRMQV